MVIIPTYNEAANVERIIASVFDTQKKLKAWIINILIVDDKSPDKTHEIVNRLMSNYPINRLQVLSGHKAGLGKAYIRGFKHALINKDYSAVVMMDADFSHDPAMIPTLLEEIDGGAEYVIGSRYVQGGSIPGNWPLKRIINSRVANTIARILTDANHGVLDMTGGFKAINTKSLNKINLDKINATGYVFQVSLLHEFVARNSKIVEIPITFKDREHGTSKMKSRDIVEFVYRAYKLNPSSRVATFFRFGTVGLSGSLVNIFVLYVLVHLTNLPITADISIAIETSIVTNFVLNHFYTFNLREGHNINRERRSRVFTKLIKFNVGAIGGALISIGAFTVLHNDFELNYILADVLAIIFATAWNFWISTKIVWKIIDART